VALGNLSDQLPQKLSGAGALFQFGRNLWPNLAYTATRNTGGLSYYTHVERALQYYLEWLEQYRERYSFRSHGKMPRQIPLSVFVPWRPLWHFTSR
jgi:hypothetical protein